MKFKKAIENVMATIRDEKEAKPYVSCAPLVFVNFVLPFFLAVFFLVLVLFITIADCVTGVLSVSSFFITVLQVAGWMLVIYAGLYAGTLVLAIFGVMWEDAVFKRRKIRALTLKEVLKKELDFEKECF